MEDSDIVIAAQSGNRKAFESLVDNHYQGIYRLAYRYTNCHHEADEICQETFLSALNNLKKLKKVSSFKPWLLSISSNLLRVKHRRKALFKNYLNSTTFVESKIQDQPLEKMSQHETKIAIQKCLQEMPEQMRLIIILVLMEGVNQKEAASITNSSEASVSRHLTMAKDILRVKLEKLDQ